MQKCPRCGQTLPAEAAFCCFCGKRIPGGAVPSVRVVRARRQKGTGCIYLRKRKNCANPYEARGSDGVFVGAYATRAEAATALDRYHADARSSTAKRRDKFTLAQVWGSFQASPAWAKLSDKGREGLLAAWPRLAPVADRVATSVSVPEYQAIIDSAMVLPRYKVLPPEQLAALPAKEQARYKKLAAQPAQPLGYDGKNRIKQLISHLYSEQIRLQIATDNLAHLIVLPAQESSRMRNFTPEERKLLRRADADPVCKLILIYLGTGMRLEELLKLPRANVDLQAHTITGGSKTKAGRNRTIPVPDDVWPYVLFFHRMGGTYLVEEGGKPIRGDTFRAHRFYPTLERLGIQYKDADGKNVLTPHRSRHTWTANAIEGGVAPEALTKVGGWSKYDVAVDKYADDLPLEYLRQEMAKSK